MPVKCFGDWAPPELVPISVELPTWVTPGADLPVGPVVVSDVQNIPAWILTVHISGASPSTLKFTESTAPTPQHVQVSPDANGAVDVGVSDFDPEVDGAIWNCTAAAPIASIPVRPISSSNR